MKPNVGKFLLLIFSVLVISCQKENDTISGQIIGKWKWIKSVSAWTGQESNPETVGYSTALEFTGDGIVKEYRNDTLLNSTNYSLEINSSDPGGNILNYGSGLRSLVYLSGDSLTLNAAYVDGPVSIYARLGR